MCEEVGQELYWGRVCGAPLGAPSQGRRIAFEMLKWSDMRSPVLVVSNFSEHSNTTRSMSNNAFKSVADCSCKAHKD